MATPTPVTLTDHELFALGFSCPSAFGGVFVRTIGDAWLSITPGPTPTAALVLDDVPVATLADVRAVIIRAQRALADHLDEAETADLNDFINREILALNATT